MMDLGAEHSTIIVGMGGWEHLPELQMPRAQGLLQGWGVLMAGIDSHINTTYKIIYKLLNSSKLSQQLQSGL